MSTPFLPFTALVLALALAGCPGYQPVTGGADDGGEPRYLPAVTLKADPSRGQFPFNVSMELDAAEDWGEMAWTLRPGDGSPPINGSDLPAQVNHTFHEAGDFRVMLTVTQGASGSSASVIIRVSATPVSEGPPTTGISPPTSWSTTQTKPPLPPSSSSDPSSSTSTSSSQTNSTTAGP